MCCTTISLFRVVFLVSGRRVSSCLSFQYFMPVTTTYSIAAILDFTQYLTLCVCIPNVSCLLLLNVALVKQVNPHWRAYFFVTDDNPFETELRSILGGHKDDRLEFLDVPLEHRPAVSVLCSIMLSFLLRMYMHLLLCSNEGCCWCGVYLCHLLCLQCYCSSTHTVVNYF